jgi:glyoxylase-like metal-dependent hydrolase (beta-lactamase superfamily II)
LPGFYARHTYSIDALPGGRSRFTSWEKAYGWGFRLTRRFWLAHFTFVRNRSLAGARALEIRYLAGDRLDAAMLPPRSYWGFFFSIICWALVLSVLLRPGIVLALLTLVAIAGRLAFAFYELFVKLACQRLAPGVHVALNGGGNTLVVEDGPDVLLVDTKFPPASGRLLRWLRANSLLPVTKTVNTHYHYDHCHGNTLFPKAERYAYENVAEFMKLNDGAWSRAHAGALPNRPVAAVGCTVMAGALEVELLHLGPGHTKGDLVVRVPKYNVIATGDLIFNGHYMFFDESAEGVDLAGNAERLRWLVSTWPGATFMPGHGPVARADDLLRAAAYIEDLLAQARKVRAEGGSAANAVRRIDLDRWDLMILPSFHDNRLQWATHASNAKAAWRLVAGHR